MEASLKLKYKNISPFEFNQVIMKIANTQTQPGKASAIRKVVNALQAARDKMSKEYDAEVLQVFFQKDADGKLLIETPEGGEDRYVPIEGKEEEIKAANKAFEEKEAEISLGGGPVLNPTILSDIKLSAKEVNLLGALFSDQTGPGVPQ